MNSLITRLEKREVWLFAAMLILHALPMFFMKIFVNHDGTAHLCNSNLIAQMLFNPDSLASQFFEFNPMLLPNWTGHVLLMLLNFVLPAWVAEKALIVIYIVAFPLAYRYLVKAINPRAVWASYLAFPFVYTLLIYLGFYNFLLSIPLMLLALGFWYKNRNDLKPLQLVLLGFILIALYFSHLLNFLILLGVCGANLLVDAIQTKDIKSAASRLLKLLLAASPALVFAAIFILKGVEEGEVKYMPLNELFDLLYRVSPMTSVTNEYEEVYTRIVFMGFVALISAKLTLMFPEREDRSSAFRWGFVALLMLSLFFIFPNEVSTGGYVSYRLSLLFFIFLGFFVAAAPQARTSIFIIVVLISIANLHRLNYYYVESEKISDGANEIVLCEPYIEDGSTVLPLNYTTNWLFGNALLYVGAERNIVVLENYEADNIHFPLIWKKGRQPNDVLGNYHWSKTPWIDIPRYEEQTGLGVDYILRYSYRDEVNDSTTLVVNDYIAQHFELVHKQGSAELFKRIADR